ncbi:hypothetical protein JG688_00015720 [Phytophthora aleatoria]|uniref:Uncharacterized protein n=1 Tax=Phytophthora aleatoria TaxID=2496075 RepID=A0A8J5LZD2_9STRA|nr:hypothetical protein JG688_00015720 [Phytophthora aleatoria]
MLRTLRYVAEMKLHLRESPHYHKLKAPVAEDFKLARRFSAKSTTNVTMLRTIHTRFGSREKRGDAYHRAMQRREIHIIFCLFGVDGSCYSIER